jgi:uncharacterized membrane protein
MPNLIVVTFEDIDKAGQVLEALREEEHHHDIRLEDSAVVIKAEDGSVEVDNVVDRGVRVGALGGGLLGLLIGFLFGGPLASLAIGAIAGALGGNLANLGIDQRFINDVSAAMEPGSSALFAMVRKDDQEAAIAAFETFKGQVHYTNLPDETEAELRRILGDQE